MSFEGFGLLLSKSDMFVCTSHEVTLGREHPDNKGNPNFFAISKAKKISRQHCVLKFNTNTLRWQATALSKNGIYVNGEYYGPGDQAVDIPHKAAVKISEEYVFLLYPQTSAVAVAS